MAVYVIKFTVQGNGPFPIDMLRYDGVHPSTGDDAGKIEQTYRRGAMCGDLGEIRVQRYVSNKRWVPEFDRWRSFMWFVTDGSIEFQKVTALP